VWLKHEALNSNCSLTKTKQQQKNPKKTTAAPREVTSFAAGPYFGSFEHSE
jgi:hypothetical protein